MNCETCKHMERIRAALAPCQACDCGSHHGRSHVQATDFTLERKITGTDGHRIGDEVRDDSMTITDLPTEIEDTLRGFMSSLFSLDMIDLLRVRSAMLGETNAQFDKSLEGLRKKMSRYKGSGRARSHEAKKRIMRAIPALYSVLSIGMKQNGPRTPREKAFT